MTIIVPVYLNGTPTEEVKVQVKANVGTIVQAAHGVDTARKLLTFPANTTELRGVVKIEYDGGTTPDGDWTFTVQIVGTENAIPKLREETSTVTIMDDDLGSGLPDRETPKDSASKSTDNPLSESFSTPPAAKKPAAKKPAAKKPAVKKPAAKKPAAKKPAAKKPAVKKPAAKKPAEKKPAAKKPAVKKPAEKKPAEKKPAAKKSAEKPGD